MIIKIQVITLSNLPNKSFKGWEVGTCVDMPFRPTIYNNVKYVH